MVTHVYDWCLVYWQGRGWYVANGIVPWQVIVVGGFWPDVPGAAYCHTPNEAAELARD